MVDKVQKIRQEVERIQLYTQSEVLKQVLDYIDEVQEEPVSYDLEEAAYQYANCFKNQFGMASMAFIKGAKWQKEQDQSTIELAEDHAMLAGMEKMKEQMMKDAIDAVVHIEAGGYPYIPQIELYDYDKDIPLAKEGDKYKVVLVNEE